MCVSVCVCVHVRVIASLRAVMPWVVSTPIRQHAIVTGKRGSPNQLCHDIEDRSYGPPTRSYFKMSLIFSMVGKLLRKVKDHHYVVPMSYCYTVCVQYHQLENVFTVKIQC